MKKPKPRATRSLSRLTPVELRVKLPASPRKRETTPHTIPIKNMNIAVPSSRNLRSPDITPPAASLRQGDSLPGRADDARSHSAHRNPSVSGVRVLWRTRPRVPRSHSCERHRGQNKTCSHECEHGTQECVRHTMLAPIRWLGLTIPEPVVIGSPAELRGAYGRITGPLGRRSAPQTPIIDT